METNCVICKKNTENDNGSVASRRIKAEKK